MQEVMNTIIEFGVHSGLTINWAKSTLMLIDVDDTQPVAQFQCLFSSTTLFKYSDSWVTPNPRDFCCLDIFPLLTQFWDRINFFKKLHLSVAGKTNPY